MPTSLTKTAAVPGWLLFFYSVPAKPVNNRMKVWRKLLAAGAIQLKGAVYLLPRSEEHAEFLQWLTTEITAMRGEAAFVRVDHIDTMADAELVDLFNRQRTQEYAAVEQGITDLARRLAAISKGGSQSAKGLAARLAKLQRGFEAVQRLDFFAAPSGIALQEKLHRLKAELEALLPDASRPASPQPIPLQRVADYRGRTWATRGKPFVDRMASAWLIKRFIDPQAAFVFLDGQKKMPAGAILFDTPAAEFTHVGDLCTFEVLLRAFGLKDASLRKMAELVHDLDLKDGKYGAAEARGVEEILTGIRRTASGDPEMLARGMEVFELLYVSKKPEAAGE